MIYARPSTVLLIDEPDVHMHIILQRQIYKHLREVASERGCQIILATHSEVIIDNTQATQIISFYGEPHPLLKDTERDRLREALKRLGPQDLLLAEQGRVLYGEGRSDFNILHAWAKILDHPLTGWFDNPYYHPIRGNNPREARAHFFALHEVNPKISGVLLLDGDDKDARDHDLRTEGLLLLRWKRYEIENYLLYPKALERFEKSEKKATPLFAGEMVNELKRRVPLAELEDPHTLNSDFMEGIAASKSILPDLFSAAGLAIDKADYYKIAEIMLPEEIHPEVREKLDAIARQFGIATA